MGSTELYDQLRNISAYEAAYRLIGCELIRYIDGIKVSGLIVETEAYDQTDKSSHSFRGITNRNSIMFQSAGIAYVYFTYGMHYCLNIVIGEEGNGSAVLIRAIEPISGKDIMLKNRKIKDIINCCNGPAKLCQALLIDKEFNGHDLNQPPLMLKLNKPITKTTISWSKRIGIKEDEDNILLWRCCLIGNAYLSRKM